MKLSKKSKETINDADFKSKVLNDISSIEDRKLLEEVSAFLESKKQMKTMKKDYGNNLYDTLNDEKMKEKWTKEKELYIDLIKLLKNLTKERHKNPWIKKEDKNTFDINEPVIKDLLNKSLFIENIWLEKWIKKLYDQWVRLWNHYKFLQDREHYVTFTKNGKLKYDVEVWD